MISAFHVGQPAHDLSRIEAQHLTQLDQFHHIHPALPAFQPRDEGLIDLHPLRKFHLLQACLASLLDEIADKSIMPMISKSFRHERPMLLHWAR